MRFPRGVSAVATDGTVFVERDVDVKKARRFAVRTVGTYSRAVRVGRIVAMYWRPLGCSPSFGSYGEYETARHCVIGGDICRLRDVVKVTDGVNFDDAKVVRDVKYVACRSVKCWLLARFFNRFGYVDDGCIEEYDNAVIDRGSEGFRPDLVLFAGSEDGRLALFTKGLRPGAEVKVGDAVRVVSYDYQSGEVKTWTTLITHEVVALVWFGTRYVLPFRAFGSYPTPVVVRSGFSGSNAWKV